MAELNNSSVNTKKSDKIVARIKATKNAGEKSFSQSENNTKQVVNARKALNKELGKAKAKKKAKMAKASRKKNK
ncbi:MAG: hypothetical protein WBF48_11430 [Halarcobacter sp.]